MHPQFESLAHSLAQAWKEGRTIPLPPTDAAPQSREDAFKVQDRMAEIIDDRCVGWKVGAAVKAVQVMEGHDGPIVGRLLASRLFTTPSQVQGALFSGCTVESEFAFRFTTDLAARARPYTREEIDPLLVFHPGLELAGPRWSNAPGQRKGTTFDAIADNGVAAAYIVGDGVQDWKHLNLAAFPVVARMDGGDPIQTYSGEFRPDPADIVLETVNGLSKRGIGMRSGDLITTGSATLPTPMFAGQTYVSRFGELMTLSLSMSRK
jgi:2-keto-4-pentenoate hydratase